MKIIILFNLILLISCSTCLEHTIDGGFELAEYYEVKKDGILKPVRCGKNGCYTREEILLGDSIAIMYKHISKKEVKKLLKEKGVNGI